MIAFALFMTGCQSAYYEQFTKNMTPEELETVAPVVICADRENFNLFELDPIIKKRKINCDKELYYLYQNTASNFSNEDLCRIWLSTEKPIERKAYNDEANSRKLNCPDILNVLNQQQIIQDINRPRHTYCNDISCTTY